MSEILSVGYRYRRRTAVPFTYVGKKYCNHCKMEVDACQEQGFQDNVFAIKLWCRRCGKVMAGAVQYVCPVLDTMPNSRFSLALEWMREPTKLTK